MVLVKNLTFFHVFFLAKTGQQNVFDDILDILESKKTFFLNLILVVTVFKL